MASAGFKSLAAGLSVDANLAARNLGGSRGKIENAVPERETDAD